MSKRVTAVIPAALVLLGGVAVTSPAFADEEKCPDRAASEWMSQEAITAKAKDLGYDVRKIKKEDGCWEVKGYDKNGKRIEAYFDPATGEVVEVKS